jgi:hypothetical protein
MTEQVDESADAPYLVPTHLRESQSIGPIPVRTFYVVLAVGLFVAAPLLAATRSQFGDGGVWWALLPFLLATPFALPWLDPPAEHGSIKLLSFALHKAIRNLTLVRIPPWTDLAEADGLCAFIRVLAEYTRGDARGISQQPDLAELLVESGVLRVPIGRRRVVRAIYRAPTINLETASAQTRRMARARWGAVLNALPHPLQIVVHGVPSTSLPVIERIKRHGRIHPPARELASWLQAHLLGAQLVERQRYVVVPADNVEQLADRCASLESSMRRIGLPLQRVEEPAELRSLVGALLLGPRRRGNRMLPVVVDVGSPDHLLIDGEHVRAFDLGKLPPAIVSDWAAPLLDGDLPLDVSIDVEPLDISWAKLQLDARRNALESSPPTPGRAVALEQITGLRMAYERRRTLPMRVAITIVLRSPYRGTLERQTK